MNQTGKKCWSTAAITLMLFLPIIQTIPGVNAQTAHAGGILNIALGYDPDTKNTHLSSSVAEDYFFAPIYETLWTMWPDSSGDPFPWMTTPDYTVSKDGLSWTFTLLKNITWHDGVRLTADDVVFTFNDIIKYKYPRMSDVSANVKDAVKVDDYTFTIHLSNTYAPFQRRILAGLVFVLPKHIWEAIENKPGFNALTYNPTPNELVGSGPFKITEYVTAQYVKYTAYKDYYRRGYKGPWGTVGPWVDQLIYPIITTADATQLALLAGKIDAARTVAFSNLPTLLANPQVGIHMTTEAGMEFWGFNNWIWPFSVKKFRKALFYAINQTEIINVTLSGYGVKGSAGSLPPTYYSPYYNPKLKDYPFNPNKTASMLDDLGIVDKAKTGWRGLVDPSTGNVFKSSSGDNTLEIYPEDGAALRVAEMISDYLAKIPRGGIRLRAVSVGTREVIRRQTLPMNSTSKPMSWIVGSGLGPDPDRMRQRFDSQYIPNPNYFGFKNSSFDKLAEQQRTTLNVPDRAKMIYQMQDIIAEELPFITLYHRMFATPYAKTKFSGWTFGPIDEGLMGWNPMCVYQTGTATPTETVAQSPAPPLQIYAAIAVAIVAIAAVVFAVTRRKTKKKI